MKRDLKKLLFVSGLLVSLAHNAVAEPLQIPAFSMAPTTFESGVNSFHDGYLPPDFPDLSKLYWAIGKFDVNDNLAIDGFLAINECDIFQKYFHNDLQWNGIRDAARQKIIKDIATFPTRFEVVIPFKLGRYDEEKRQFEITPHTSLNGAKKFDVAYNKEDRAICGLGEEAKGYPRNIILVLSRPFDFKVLPVSPELANLFINNTQKQYTNASVQERVSGYEREAYLRMKVHILQYKEEEQASTGLHATVLGRLEGFEVYGDPDRTELLYKQNVIDDKLYHHVRDVKTPLPASANTQATPSTPTPTPVAIPPQSTVSSKVVIPPYQPYGSEEGTESDSAPDTAAPIVKP